MAAIQPKYGTRANFWNAYIKYASDSEQCPTYIGWEGLWSWSIIVTLLYLHIHCTIFQWSAVLHNVIYYDISQLGQQYLLNNMVQWRDIVLPCEINDCWLTSTETNIFLYATESASTSFYNYVYILKHTKDCAYWQLFHIVI